MKNEKGITLVSLIIYLIFLSFSISMLLIMTRDISFGTTSIYDSAQGVGSFNSFNTSFIQDVKSSESCKVEKDSNGNIRITLSNGSIYTYVTNEKTIYRNSIKISTNISEFEVTYNDESKKNIVVKITIGDSKTYLYGKKIRYVFKYWLEDKMANRGPLGIELVRRGIVSEESIKNALDYQKKNPNERLGDILYQQGAADPEVLLKAMGEIMDERTIFLHDSDIKVNPENYITIDEMRNSYAMPFDVDNGAVKVCFASVTNSAQIESIRLELLNKGLILQRYITFKKNIQKIIDKMTGKLAQINDDTDVTTIIDNIIRGGMKNRASDIHIEPMRDYIRVRYRIDGKLFEIAKIDKSKQEQVVGRLKSLSNMHQEKQDPQDGRIIDYPDYNIRSSSQKNIYGEKFVLRLLKKDETIKTLYELGYPHDEKLMKDAFDKRNSITIIAAPTGEGKTTTLYSAISYLNRPDVNITTIEDPVEIRIPGLNQIEIDPRTTFAGSLRTVLRQDPNIILVGEIRDKETAEIAMQAGQTGHYVLSTIHTLNAIEVITRLREIGISNYDISSTVATSISQRLIRKLCPECKKERPFTEEEKNIIRKIGEKYNINYDVDNAKTYEAVGCEKCHDSGYFDRTGIFETMIFSETIQQMIIEGKSTIEIRKEALNEGYRPLLLQGIERVLDGTTTLDELNSKLLFY